MEVPFSKEYVSRTYTKKNPEITVGFMMTEKNFAMHACVCQILVEKIATAELLTSFITVKVKALR